MSGLAAALYASPRLAVLTDLNANTLANLQHNADLLTAALEKAAAAAGAAGKGGGHQGGQERQGASCEVRVARLDWADTSTWPTQPPNQPPNQPATGAARGAAGEGVGGLVGGEGVGQRRALFDVVLGSDLVYEEAIAPLLASVVLG